MEAVCREKTEKRFNKVLKGPFVLAVLAIGIGILLLISGVNEWIVAPETPVVCCAVMILLGAGHGITGIWGVSFCKRRHIVFPQDALIVYERGIVLVLGWLIWTLAALFSIVAVVFCLGYEPEAGMVFTVLATLLLFFAFFIFAGYRNRRIVLQENLVERVNSFGRTTTYSSGEILGMVENIAVGGSVFIGPDGKSLFSCGRNSVNSAAFLHEMTERICGERSDGVAEGPETERRLFSEAFLEELQKDSWQTRHVRGIQRGGVLVGIFHIAAMLVLFYVYEHGDFLKGRYYYLIQVLLPLSYYIFAWIFKDVVLWGPIDGKRYQLNGKERYAAIYVSVMFGMFFWVRVVVQSLLMNMQCIRGIEKITGFGAVIFFGLFLLSALCLGFRKPKRELFGQWVLIAIFSIVFSVGITEGIFLAASEPPVHYEADVINTSKYSGSQTSYYADVVLKNGSMEHIEISKAIYERIGGEEAVVICDRTSLFDTEFVTIHRPE